VLKNNRNKHKKLTAVTIVSNSVGLLEKNDDAVTVAKQMRQQLFQNTKKIYIFLEQCNIMQHIILEHSKQSE